VSPPPPPPRPHFPNRGLWKGPPLVGSGARARFPRPTKNAPGPPVRPGRVFGPQKKCARPPRKKFLPLPCGAFSEEILFRGPGFPPLHNFKTTKLAAGGDAISRAKEKTLFPGAGVFAPHPRFPTAPPPLEFSHPVLPRSPTPPGAPPAGQKISWSPHRESPPRPPRGGSRAARLSPPPPSPPLHSAPPFSAGRKKIFCPPAPGGRPSKN